MKTLPIKELSIQQLNNLLDSGQPYINSGKVKIIFQTGSFSIKDRTPYLATSLDAVANRVIENLKDYQIALETPIENQNIFQRLSLPQIKTIEKQKEFIQSAKETLNKITLLDNLSKQQIKKAGIITRLFFFIRNILSSLFLKIQVANNLINIHEKIVARKEKDIEPYLINHKIYTYPKSIFNTATALGTICSIFKSFIPPLETLAQKNRYFNNFLSASMFYTIITNVIGPTLKTQMNHISQA